MAIWGNRDSESPDETSAGVTPAAATPGNDPSATAVPEGGAHKSEPPPGESAHAFWRAQRRPMAPGYGRADEPEPGSGRGPVEVAAPPVSDSPIGTDAPAPVLAEDVVVLDSE